MFQVCNIKPCGYDVGDCGTANYDKLIGYSLEKKDSHYVIPKGIVFLSLVLGWLCFIKTSQG
jgi:hypothetical protein